MRFKRFLIIVLVFSAALYGFYVMRVNERISGVYHLLGLAEFWAYAAAALVLLLAGHVLRSYKFKLILRPVKESGTRTQFQSLLIGYLFNTILPLRIGEIVRAFVLGRSLQVSASLMFALILLERAFDGLILGVLGLALAAASSTPDSTRWAIAGFSVALLAVSTAFFVILALLQRQNHAVLRWWHRFSAMFNLRLRNSLRFKLWSVIYGLDKLNNRPALYRYAALSVAMWVCYILALIVLATYFFGFNPVSNLLHAFIAFLGVSVPSGPAYLGSYQAVTDPLLRAIADGRPYLNWLVMSWLMLAVPSSLIGIVLLLRHRTNYGRLLRSTSIDSLHDKLARREDISQEFEPFLDAFFSGNTLSRILHRLEAGENIKLIRYFKGGSDASTLLVHQDDHYVVKKIIPAQYADRLKAQHNWLKEHSHHEKIVTLKNERETPSYYSIDIEYYPGFEPFFEYLHSQTMKKSQHIEKEVFEFLFENIYRPKPARTNTEALEGYIASKMNGKLGQASKINAELAALRTFDTIVVNGVEYDNLQHIMKRIRKTPAAWRDISTYRESPVHGDITIDNILASTKRNEFKIIDPAPDQLEICGPVFDFGRHYQSLGYGYEFLSRDNTKVHAKGNVIQYEDSTSAAYRDLEQYFLSDIVPRWLTPEEQRAFKFHTAMNYSRLLAHRVHINPDNVAKFYAVSVRAFNDFLDQYTT